jgi:hypothetical protein
MVSLPQVSLVEEYRQELYSVVAFLVEFQAQESLEEASQVVSLPQVWSAGVFLVVV